jgi:hypothetical protein
LTRITPAFGALLLLAGCSTAFQTPSSLSRDDRLSEGERRLVPVLEYADGAALASVAELHVPLVVIAPEAEIDPRIGADRLDRLRANLSKDLCQRFARGGFSVVPEPDGEAETVRLEAAITGLRRNNIATTGLSRAIGVAVPGPLNPRVPVGIGALGAEGEIVGPDGTQLAAIRWASQNHLASGGGVTTILDGPDAFGDLADATELSSVFADAFGDLVVEARGDFAAQEGETPSGTCDAYFDMVEPGEAG